jgi:hypothetical protein
MPSKVLVSGILMIVTACILVFVVEFFLPLSVKADMNMLCRNTLLKMELRGGLAEEERLGLQAELQNKGFECVSVSGTPHAKQGSLLNLHVEADYRFSRLTALFSRSDAVLHMGYDKVSMSRRVVN